MATRDGLDEDAAGDGQRLATLDRRIRRVRDTAQLMLIIALGSFPIVAAYHIDVDPSLRLTFDLGSGMWIALTVGAVVVWLRGVQLARRRRRLGSVHGLAADVVAAPPPAI